MSASESRSALVLELAEELLERYRQGERPSLKEYIDRHPELAAEIKDVFPAMALMENVALADESLADASREAGSAFGETPPVQLGDYRILREVGRGGMGIVYEAEQISLGRHVALKVLPRKVLLQAAQKRRFEREAKAAARLHHTNIVPVFGVGEQDGMPYYVMQLIQGLGLDLVLEELKRLQSSGEPPVSPLPMAREAVMARGVARTLLTGALADAERLGDNAPCQHARAALTQAGSAEIASDAGKSSSTALPLSSVNLPSGSGKGKKSSYWQSVARIGIQVADALDYAHKQGLQHRDIKPSNLLLDTRGTVWVTDFGLARADNEEHLTRTDDIVGTLRYLPPEAFEGQADARGDLYSLGLTLYELLALRPAFAERDRNKLIKQVTATEPARLGKLNRAIPRDLATIVHKAIDREPARRYQTAAELAADLQRFLDDEPIHARQVSARERSWRWCRRNPAVAALLTAVFVLLVAVAALSSGAALHFAAAQTKEKTLRRVADAALVRSEEANQREVEQHRQTEAARAESERQKQLAEENFRQARQAVDDYLTRVSENRLLRVPGMQPLRQELLQSALHYYQGFLKQHGQDAALGKDLAAAYLRLATITAEIGSPREALALCLKGQELLEDLQRQDPNSKEIRLDLVACRQTAGSLQRRLGQLDAALQSCRQAYRTLLEVSPQDPSRKAQVVRVSGAAANGIPVHSSKDPEILGRFFSVLNDTGAVYRQMGELGAALYHYDQALLIQESLVRDHPRHPRIVSFKHGLARAWSRLGDLQAEVGMYDDAQACHQKTQTILEQLLREHPRHEDAADFQRDLAASQESDGDILARTGQLDDAHKAYESALPLRQRLARQNPAVTAYQTDLARNYFQQALLDLRAHRPAEALPALQQAIEHQRGLVETAPGIKSYVRTLSRQLGRLGAVQRQLQQPAAEQSYQEARKLLKQLPPSEAGDWYELGLWRAACSDADSALQALQQAIEAGYHDLDRLQKDAELAPLRSRPEFQKLVEEVRRRTKILHWMDDIDAARVQAGKEKKDLFLWFGASDWAPLDMIQRKTRFERAAFIDYAAKHFVMVDLDSPKYKPRPKNYAKTLALMRTWQIRGYPWAVLTDARGRPYGMLSADREGTRSLEQLIAELEEQRRLRVRRDELLAQAAASKGLEKAKLLDRALSIVPAQLLMSYRDVVQQILALDRDNQAELRSKYQARVPPTRADATPLFRGDQHWKAGRLAEAIHSWQREIERREAVLKKDKDNLLAKRQLARLHQRMGTAYAEVGLWDEAATALEAVWQCQPDWDDSWTWFGRAALALQRGKPERFRQMCQDFLKLPMDPTHKHWITRLNMLGPAAYGDADLAVTVARNELRIWRSDWYCFVLGAALYRAGRYQEAEQTIRESLGPKYHPEGYVSHRWFWLALACQRQGKTEDARQWLRKGVEWMDHGRIEQKPAGGPDDARWNQSLELRLVRREAEMLITGTASPEPMDVVLKRALACIRLEQPNKAAADLARIDHFQPDTPLRWKERGQIYAALGQTEKAASDFAKALELSGQEDATLRREIYAELDRSEQLLSKVVALRPTDSELAAFCRARNANASDKDKPKK